MRIAIVIGVCVLAMTACTTVNPPTQPVVVEGDRPDTTIVVPAKPVAVVPSGSVYVPG